MEPRRFGLILLYTCAFSMMGCKVEKAPPRVQWLSPSTVITVDAGDAVALRFRIEDPAPDRGSVPPAEWRISLGPTGGGTWWTTAGTLTEGPGNGTLVDTVTTTWQVSGLPPGSSGPVELMLTALVTDGAGQVGADFGTVQLIGTPLTSGGLWWSESGGLHHAPPNGPTSTHPVEAGLPGHLVHMDGDAVIIKGDQMLYGWSLDDGIPVGTPAWVRPPPDGSADFVRQLRRVPYVHANTSWVEVAWRNRVEWLDAQGNLIRGWLLESDESLIDCGIMGGALVVLARTDAGDWRLIRHHIDTGARLGAITWTPEAQGSQGQEGNGWLLETDGMPAALESDGHLRIWNPNGGATPITTVSAAGSGEVQYAGRTENGRAWLTRDQSTLLDHNLTVIAQWPEQVLATAEDRAEQTTWVLLAADDQRYWQPWDNLGAAFTAPPLPAGPDAHSGSIAHNRPGPL